MVEWEGGGEIREEGLKDGDSFNRGKIINFRFLKLKFCH